MIKLTIGLGVAVVVLIGVVLWMAILLQSAWRKNSAVNENTTRRKSRAVNENTTNSIQTFDLDQYTTDFYIGQVQKMTQIYTIKKIEVVTGKNFADLNGVIPDIPNEELITAHREVQEEIVNDMSDSMFNYLVFVLGEEYLRKYISNFTLSLLINYHEYNVKDIIKIK